MLKRYIPDEKLRNTCEWLLMIAVAAGLYLLIHKFVFINATVMGNSMEPSFSHGDKVMVTGFSYWFSKPAYYDVVAFPYKANPGEYYIKRIIGLPGDKVDLVGNCFTINGEPLEDDFSDEPIYALGDTIFPITVPEGSYFVLGDNSNESMDSRYTSVGCVPEDDIIGKASFRIWPPEKIGFIGK